jgi:hypothetical protein
MKIAMAILAKAAQLELTRMKAGCLLFLFAHLISGCAVLNNSFSFYQNQPRRPINWREYTSD